MQKHEKTSSGENTEGITGQLFAKEIKHLMCGSSQTSRQKCCQFGMKRSVTRWNKGRLLGFWDSRVIERVHNIYASECVIPCEKGRMAPEVDWGLALLWLPKAGLPYW